MLYSTLFTGIATVNKNTCSRVTAYTTEVNHFKVNQYVKDMSMKEWWIINRRKTCLWTGLQDHVN